MKKILIILVGLLVLASIGYASLYRGFHRQILQGTTIPAKYTEAKFFQEAIASAHGVALNKKISGIIVPHHLLAIRLIADTFVRLAANHYDQIVLISPDHYNAGLTSISIANRNLATVFGELEIDQDLEQTLFKIPSTSLADFFYREHGVQAQLPFVKYFFPQAKITVIAIKSTAKKEELDFLADILKRNLSANSLIIQSTDFSHYLSRQQAAEADQKTVAIVERNNPAEIWQLNNPINIDSPAAFYIQARLQKEFYQSRPQIIQHKNSQDYTKKVLDHTTSYFTILYE